MVIKKIFPPLMWNAGNNKVRFKGISDKRDKK